MAGENFESVTVDIETDFDDGAAMGLGVANAAPLETRLAIRIKDSLPESEVSAIIENTLGRESWFLALRNAQNVNCKLVVDK